METGSVRRLADSDSIFISCLGIAAHGDGVETGCIGREAACEGGIAAGIGRLAVCAGLEAASVSLATRRGRLVTRSRSLPAECLCAYAGSYGFCTHRSRVEARSDGRLAYSDSIFIQSLSIDADCNGIVAQRDRIYADGGRTVEVGVGILANSGSV